MSFLLILLLIEAPPNVVWTSLPGHDTADIESTDDINSDGTNDILVASLLNQSTGLFCLSGADGSVLWNNLELPGILHAGALTVFPDVNNDGVSDLALATGWGTSPWDNMIIALSGADGSIIWSFDTGFPVQSVNYTEGPLGTYPVLHAAVVDYSGYTRFLALNGLSGDSLWVHFTWTDDNTVVTTGDMNGNNWEEIGISQDRGSAYSGLCEVIDGLTGEQLYQTETIYFCRMDITDTPSHIIATGHWGIYPHLVLEDMNTSDTLFQVNEEPPYSDNLHFTRNVTGGDLEFPVLLGWQMQTMYIYSGLTGIYSDPYNFSGDIVSVTEYQISSAEWKLAVLTETGFYTAAPVLTNPYLGEVCNLPGGSGTDLSLLDSDLYPTPIAAVAMKPGVAAIATSWPLSTERETSEPILTQPHVTIQTLPGINGLTFSCNAPGEIVILDITGRQIQSFQSIPGEQRFMNLSAGMYLIVEMNSESAIQKAIVTGE